MKKKINKRIALANYTSKEEHLTNNPVSMETKRTFFCVLSKSYTPQKREENGLVTMVWI